ncbi:MAG: UDP-N-acetylglucosamine--N-acetylmuramyl-(pentapeptide) pyrophosphoryl-undecaprenol N-acetylglucosamine transferase [Candidatus Coatesbacteria bacterium]|nr:UDP-N-acetylglucosamine--N-acetylmuramyl-(pentapeptide) pyrophosphoryl-undecaprenol N-acetylglucosamine transferase [Candidatus Coatesbacteria bacterium]
MASGATGGHAYPCLVVADAIRELRPDARFLFIGAGGKIDRDIIRKHGYEFAAIKASGFCRGSSFGSLAKTVLAASRLITLGPLLEALRHLRRFRPDAVFGAGGYVSGPVIAAAWLRRIPRAILEANAVPGLANRLAARLVDCVYIGFEPVAMYFKVPGEVMLTGNPVRPVSELRGRSMRDQMGFDSKKLLVVIVGGSLGSKFLNDLCASLVPMINNDANVSSRVEVLHCVGQRFWEDAALERSESAKDLRFRYLRVPYADGLSDLFAAADVVISRGGASSLSELALAGTASIVIPWPQAANNEQVKNAEYFAQNGASFLLKEHECDASTLFSRLAELVLDDDLREQMRVRSRQLARPRAANDIAKSLICLSGGSAVEVV